MPSLSTAGYVLAGGRSSRMGTDKAQLPWRGSSLLDYVANEVQAATGSVTIVGGDALSSFRVIADEFPGFGPVGGIATALADSTAEWTLVAACDMPGVTCDWLRRLIDEAAGQVFIPRTPEGRIHPLLALWHKSASGPMREAVLAGIHTVREAIRVLDCRWMDLEDAHAVSNVNTPEDWLRLRE